MHEHLPDLAGRGQLLDVAQTVTLIIARLAGDRLLADFNDRQTFARGVLLQLVDLTIGFLFRGGDANEDRDGDGEFVPHARTLPCRQISAGVPQKNLVDRLLLQRTRFAASAG